MGISYSWIIGTEGGEGPTATCVDDNTKNPYCTCSSQFGPGIWGERDFGPEFGYARYCQVPNPDPKVDGTKWHCDKSTKPADAAHTYSCVPGEGIYTKPPCLGQWIADTYECASSAFECVPLSWPQKGGKSLDECQKICNPPPQTGQYACEGGDGCRIDPLGTFTLQECQNICR